MATTVTTIKTEIVADLGPNYSVSDSTVLENIINDVVADALFMSNRTNTEVNLSILKSNIKKAAKEIYLQRGVEDVKSNTQSGLSNVYDNAIETMLHDIIRENKRIMR